MGTKVKNYWLQHACEVIKETYGDVVSVNFKKKDLLKFGRNKLVQATKSTLMTFPAGISNETYVSTNIITTISSSSTSDTGNVIVEYHTVNADGEFKFGTQTITLNGQTQVPLTTPSARISRVVNDGSDDLVGSIYVYEDDTSTAGVPDTASTVHAIIDAGLNNTEKAATTISNEDYWILTEFYGDCLEKTATFGIIHLEIREKGKTFINRVDISASTNGRGRHEFLPYVIVPKNADIRLRCVGGAANKDFSGGIEGVLASVV